MGVHLFGELARNLLRGPEHGVELGGRCRGRLRDWLLRLRCGLRHELGRHLLRMPHSRLRLRGQILHRTSKHISTV